MERFFAAQTLNWLDFRRSNQIIQLADPVDNEIQPVSR
jgi:hypothetical protein